MKNTFSVVAGGRGGSGDPPPASSCFAKFHELASAHVASYGGQWSIVWRHAQEAQWRAWMAYFVWFGVVNTEVFEMIGVLTVPTEWPQEFDASTPPPPDPKPPSPPLSDKRRRQLASQLKLVGVKLKGEP
jgi:hypothetical protein